MDNEKFIMALKGIMSTIGGVVSAMVGGCDPLFALFCLLVVFDFLTGIASAVKHEKFRSSVMRWVTKLLQHN